MMPVPACVRADTKSPGAIVKSSPAVEARTSIPVERVEATDGLKRT
jgi:hypothetical protein